MYVCMYEYYICIYIYIIYTIYVVYVNQSYQMQRIYKHIHIPGPLILVCFLRALSNLTHLEKNCVSKS